MCWVHLLRSTIQFLCILETLLHVTLKRPSEISAHIFAFILCYVSLSFKNLTIIKCWIIVSYCTNAVSHVLHTTDGFRTTSSKSQLVSDFSPYCKKIKEKIGLGLQILQKDFKLFSCQKTGKK